MKKTYYFQHDFEAINDPKIQYLISEFGAYSYGLWWRIVELLHSSNDNRLEHKKYLYCSIASQLKLTIEDVTNFVNFCIEDAEILQSDGDFFWSERVLKNVGKMEMIKEKRSQAGKKSAEKRADNEAVATSVQQNTTSVQHLSRKEKKIKEKKEYIYPILEDVILFFKENGYSESVAKQAWNYYEDAGWSDSSGKKVLNWKQKMRGVWFRDEHKINKPSINFSMPIN